MGGTTTDLGVIQNGFPRESGVAVTIGGVRTNFRMPDVVSIGLGGGSIVREKADGTVTVGPDTVGYQITEKALVLWRRCDVPLPTLPCALAWQNWATRQG